MPRPTLPALLDNADEVEALFYEALQQGDIVKLMSVFADEDEVACVHPGGPRVIGGAAIRESFEAIFSNGVIPVRPEQVRRFNALGLAVHHVVERVPVAAGSGGPPQDAWVLATNVYVKTALGWRMLSHHASPGMAQAPSDPREPPATLH